MSFHKRDNLLNALVCNAPPSFLCQQIYNTDIVQTKINTVLLAEMKLYSKDKK